VTKKTIRMLYEYEGREDQRPVRVSELEARRKYHREHEARVAAYGIKEGDLVVVTGSNSRHYGQGGLFPGDRVLVDQLGLICRERTRGTYIDIDHLRKVDASLGEFIAGWDSRGSLLCGKVQPLTQDEVVAERARADEKPTDTTRGDA